MSINSNEFYSLNERRNFSESLSAIGEIIKQEWRGMIKTTWKTCAPWIILGLAGKGLVGYFTISLVNIIKTQTSDYLLPQALEIFSIYGVLIIGILILAITGMFVSNSLLQYLRLRELFQATPTVDQVQEAFSSTTGRYVKLMLAIPFLYVVLILVMIVALSLLTILVSSWMLLLWLPLMVVLLWSLVPLSLSKVVVAFENRTLLESVRKMIALSKDNWWFTAGLVVLTSIAVGIVSWVFTIPFLIFQALSTVMDTGIGGLGISVGGLISAVSSVVTSIVDLLALLISITTIVVAYYHNSIRATSDGLMELADSLGTNAQNVE
jgi:hypothetical protein